MSRDGSDWGDEERTQRHAENLESGRSGSLMEEMKHPGSSLWLLYRMNREVGLLHTVEQGGGLLHIDKQGERV